MSTETCAPVELTFTPFPKIARLHKPVVITEKLDGTNAAIVCTEDGLIYAQSRKKVITPENDNYGFARWVHENAMDLFEYLGEGVHFGEWWGKGIQRGYGVGTKRFSLFNTNRWSSAFNSCHDGNYHPATALALCEADGYTDDGMHECIGSLTPGLQVVPVLRRLDHFGIPTIDATYLDLRDSGSYAAPGFSNPEGVVIFHTAQGHLYKLSDAKVQP